MTEGKSQLLWMLKKKETGKIYDKISLALLKAWVSEGRVKPDDYLTNAKIKKWLPALEVAEIRSDFSIFFSEVEDISATEEVSEDDASFPWSNQTEEEDLTLDMTPMIDVTFLLLIFFMVTATFSINEIKNIQVPKAKVTKSFKQDKLSISVDKNRQIYLGTEAISLRSLKTRLAIEVSKTRQQDVVLAADHGLDYGFIVLVLDEINGAGIKNVKLKLEKKQ